MAFVRGTVHCYRKVDCLTLRIRKSLRTKFVRLLATMYTRGRTRPHTTKMPQGCGSSSRYVISKPVRSSTLKSKTSVCRQHASVSIAP